MNTPKRVAKDAGIARARGVNPSRPNYIKQVEIGILLREQAEDNEYGHRTSDLRSLSLDVAIGEQGDMTWKDTLVSLDDADRWLMEHDEEGE